MDKLKNLLFIFTLATLTISFLAIAQPAKAQEVGDGCYAANECGNYCESTLVRNSAGRLVCNCTPPACAVAPTQPPAQSTPTPTPWLNQATPTPAQPTPTPYTGETCAVPAPVGSSCSLCRARMDAGGCTGDIVYCEPAGCYGSTEPNPSGTPSPSRGPAPTQSAKVINPSLNNDYAIAYNTSIAIIPKEARSTPTPVPGAPIPTLGPTQIGVEQDLLRSIFSNLFCRIPLFSHFCPAELDLAGGKTKPFADYSEALSKSDRPQEVDPDPAQKSGELADDFSTGVRGNEQLDKINTSLGDKTGFYASDLPDELMADTQRRADQLQQQQNLKLNSYSFSDDKRSPIIDAEQENFWTKYYPTGIQPLKQ